MKLKTILLGICFALISLTLSVNTSFAQTVPENLNGTVWYKGYEDEEFLDYVTTHQIVFKDKNVVEMYIGDVLGELWYGTYKQDGKTFKAKFTSYKQTSDGPMTKDKLEIEGRFGRYENDRTKGMKTKLEITKVSTKNESAKDAFKFLPVYLFYSED